MPESQRRLAAIMFTDMVGSTALAQKDEELSLQVVEDHRRLLRPVFARHGGREVKTMGDGFLVEFSSALDGARCAYDVQRSAREYNISSPAERRIRLRVGVHLGDVVESGGDISGDAVNVASRIEHLAEEGGVCLTRQVYDHVKNKLDLKFESLGEVPLRNVAEAVEVYRIVMPWNVSAEASKKPAERGRIAVLPFANLSPNPEDGFFADGITEEVITTLSNVSGLSVISRTSAMKYKGSAKGVREIGSELGVGSILEGSLRKMGNKIRVTTQLIDVAQDKHLWAQNYDRELTDVFEVQSDIAKQVSEALRTRILPQETARIDRPPTKDIHAFELYLKGRQYLAERSVDSLKKSVNCFESALNRDQGFALAYIGIATSYGVLVSYGHVSSEEGTPIMERMVAKALELDADQAEAHAMLASIAAYRWDWGRSEEEFRRSIELNPSYVTSHHWMSILLSHTFRFDEALAEMKRAQELDPLSLILVTARGVVHFYRREFALAEEYHRQALSLDPNFQPAQINLSIVLMHLGRHDEFARLFSTLDESYGRVDTAKAVRAESLYFLGRKDEAMSNLAEAVEVWKQKKVGAVEIASAYMRMGDPDETFRWLDLAWAERTWSLAGISVDPWWDPIRKDPRYADLISRMGIPAPKTSPSCES